MIASSRDYHAHRARAHLPGDLIPVVNTNHFTILDELRHPSSVLTRAVCRWPNTGGHESLGEVPDRTNGPLTPSQQRRRLSSSVHIRSRWLPTGCRPNPYSCSYGNFGPISLTGYADPSAAHPRSARAPSSPRHLLQAPPICAKITNRPLTLPWLIFLFVLCWSQLPTAGPAAMTLPAPTITDAHPQEARPQHARGQGALVHERAQARPARPLLRHPARGGQGRVGAARPGPAAGPRPGRRRRGEAGHRDRGRDVERDQGRPHPGRDHGRDPALPCRAAATARTCRSRRTLVPSARRSAT